MPRPGGCRPAFAAGADSAGVAVLALAFGSALATLSSTIPTRLHAASFSLAGMALNVTLTGVQSAIKQKFAAIAPAHLGAGAEHCTEAHMEEVAATLADAASI